VYDGLTDDEVDRLADAIRQRADLTRVFEYAACASWARRQRKRAMNSAPADLRKDSLNRKKLFPRLLEMRTDNWQ
jgi:hypothetical protein